MKTTRQQLDIINAYLELGSYRAAAQLCGITDKTVKRVLERQQRCDLGAAWGGGSAAHRPPGAEDVLGAGTQCHELLLHRRPRPDLPARTARPATVVLIQDGRSSRWA